MGRPCGRSAGPVSRPDTSYRVSEVISPKLSEDVKRYHWGGDDVRELMNYEALATVSPSSSLMKTNREEEVDHFLLWDPAVAPRIMKSMDDLKLRVEAFVVIADLVRTDAWGRFVLDLASHEGAWAVFHNAAKLRDDRECDKKVLVDFFSLPAWLRSFEFSGN